MQKNRIATGKQAGRNGLAKVKKAVATLIGAAYLAAGTVSLTVCASGGANAITQPLENLKTLVISVIGAVGVIILAKNVMEFAQAYQQQDSSTMNSALKGIVAGIMMAGISTVLSFLGF
ncbi:hypothetical protein [Candidatus Merdisoma sp. JLR.KK006]|uniref:hypothetical protein n=1 Tax=Candidatus Merdisoma sp. JLR.KK006 TaxID=3112626 RepID=UPI002FEFC6F5